MALLPNSVLQTATLTGNPAMTQNPDNSVASNLAGRHGEQLVSRIHGEGYVSRSRGNGFCATSAAAGLSILAAGGTTGGLVLFNPPGSGVIVELERFAFSGATVMTQVVAGLGLEGSLQTPSGTLTLMTTSVFPLGGSGAAKARLYGSAPTITAMTVICSLGLTIQSTTISSPVLISEFNGRMLIGPGFSVNVYSSITQGANKIIADVFWSEWPV